jgi:multidrug efflux system membrane fusion protein
MSNPGTPAEPEHLPGGTDGKLLHTPEGGGPSKTALPVSKPRTRRRRWWLPVLLVLILGTGAFLLLHQKPKAGAGNASGPGRGAGRGPGAIPVVAAKAQSGSIGVFITGLGQVTPLNTVTTRSRVDGQLMSVNFREGDLVRKGALLAKIDPGPYQAQVDQFEGQLTRDQAALRNAQIDLRRYETLLAQNAIPEQQLTTQQALVVQDQGNVKQDQGLLEGARVNLAYTRITAPITGRVGLRLVDPGNIIHASDTNGMLVITQVQPISVIFTVAEDQLPPIRLKLRAGQRLPVDAFDRDMKTKLASGVLTTIDNQIDPTTGTLRLRAIFDNRDDALFPNEFVNARLLLQEKRGVTLIPSAAVQRSTQTTFVYLIRPDSTVVSRPVVLGTTESGQSEIVSGLAPGDAVAMTGVDKLQDGSKVIPHIDDGAQASSGDDQ